MFAFFGALTSVGALFIFGRGGQCSYTPRRIVAAVSAKTPRYTKVAKKVKSDPATVSKYVKEYEAAVRAAGVVIHAKNKE